MNIFRRKKKTSGDSFELICELVRKTLGGDSNRIPLDADTRLLDIGFDSIKYTNLLLNLEDVVDTDLETLAQEIDLSSIERISDIIALVDKIRKGNDATNPV